MTTLPHDAPTAQELIENHSRERIRQRLQLDPSASYLRDFVYGAIDGAVTTLAVVSGVAGAGLSADIVLILGVANLIGDGFSMAAGNFLGTRAEEQQLARTRRMEERHIDLAPEGEREEIRQIFASQGFEGRDLERVVNVITSNRQRWVDTMLKEEHGLTLAPRSAVTAAGMTFLAFIVVGLIPLLPFLVNWILGDTIPRPFVGSAVLTGVAFFGVGAAKSRFVDETWWGSGLETLFVGSLAAGLAYVVGLWLGGLVG